MRTVYVIENSTTSEYYIGQTRNTIKQRFTGHRGAANKARRSKANVKHPRIATEMAKDFDSNYDNWSICAVHITETLEEALCIESALMDSFINHNEVILNTEKLQYNSLHKTIADDLYFEYMARDKEQSSIMSDNYSNSNIFTLLKIQELIFSTKFDDLRDVHDFFEIIKGMHEQVRIQVHS